MFSVVSFSQVGLLPKCNHQQVPFAYKMYSREDSLGWRQSADFKKAFSIDVDIEMIGVWYVPSDLHRRNVLPHRLLGRLSAQLA